MASARRHPILKTCLGTLMLREDKENAAKSGEDKSTGSAEVAGVADELNAMDVRGLTPQASASTSGGGSTPQSLPAPPKGGQAVLRNRKDSVGSTKSNSSTKVVL